jgi:hypothetical protein
MFGNMFSKEAMMNRFFRKIEDAVWDLQSGKIGLATKEGIATIDGLGDDASISINPIEQFGIPVPSFAQNTPLADVKVGDLLYGTTAGTRGWITKIIVNDKEDGSKTYKFKILTPSGTETTFTPPKIAMFGFDPSGAMIVRSLFNMMGSSEGLAGLQGNLMPLMMMGGDMEDIGDILPMVMMSGMGGAGNTGNMGSMMQTMMMMKMMGKTIGTTRPATGKSGAGADFFRRN